MFYHTALISVVDDAASAPASSMRPTSLSRTHHRRCHLIGNRHSHRRRRAVGVLGNGAPSPLFGGVNSQRQKICFATATFLSASLNAFFSPFNRPKLAGKRWSLANFYAKLPAPTHSLVFIVRRQPSAVHQHWRARHTHHRPDRTLARKCYTPCYPCLWLLAVKDTPIRIRKFLVGNF